MRFKQKQLIAACSVALAFAYLPGNALADDSAEIKALKAQIEALRQKVDELAAKQASAEVKQEKIERTVTTVAAAAPAAGGGEPLFQSFIKGFYGTLDVSLDDATKGINGMGAL